LIENQGEHASEKMKEFLAGISIVKNYINTLEKITNNLVQYKQQSEGLIGDEQISISKKIEDDINKGMNLQNSSNTLMKNITEMIKKVKEEVKLY
jgi:hypothetical protein